MKASPRAALGRLLPWSALSRNAPEWLFESAEIAYNAYAAPALEWRLRQKSYGLIYERYALFSVAGVMMAKENHVPFFVAAPISTLDLTLASGDEIPIEQRAAAEVTHVFGTPVAPAGTAVENPAFDVTPWRYVGAIITERGVARAPYEESLRKLAATAA